jgi:class 3 adenylate cyclase
MQIGIGIASLTVLAGNGRPYPGLQLEAKKV